MPVTNEDKYAITSWGKPQTFDFKCPSGQMCQIRRLDVDMLLENGALNKLDKLTSVVNNSHIPNATAGRKKTQAAMQKQIAADLAKKSPEELRELSKLVNQVVLEAVVQPPLAPVPDDSDDRKPDVIYVDAVSYSDRIAIFNKAMEDISNLETFRGDTDKPVGAVEDVESLSSPAE